MVIGIAINIDNNKHPITREFEGFSPINQNNKKLKLNANKYPIMYEIDKIKVVPIVDSFFIFSSSFILVNFFFF